ncbi:glycosyltransferase family 9 protein [Aquifex sp.]
MKFLLIQRRALGDALYTSLVSDVLKKEFPDAKIYLLTLKPLCELIENLPIDRCIAYKSLVDAVKRIRKIKPDVVLDYEATFKTYPLVILSGAKKRIAFYKKKREKLLYPIYTDLIDYIDYGFPFWDRLRLLKALEVDYERYIKRRYLPKVFPKGSKKEKYIVITPKGKLKGKTISPERVKVLFDKLTDFYEVKVCVEQKEKEYTDRLKSLGIPVLNLNMREFKELLSRSKGLITVEAFPYHLALLLGIKSLVVLQSTGPFVKETFGLIRYYRLPLDCLECHKKVCPKGTYECTFTIGENKLIREALEFFSS